MTLTVPEIKFFFDQLRKGNIDDISYRKTLINVFVNAIYLYDDKIVIFFNSGDNPVTVDDELIGAAENWFAFEPCCSTSPRRRAPNPSSDKFILPEVLFSLKSKAFSTDRRDGATE